jgi:hypothetical protein
MTQNVTESPLRILGNLRAGLKAVGGSRSLSRAAEFYKRAAYDARNEWFTSSMALEKKNRPSKTAGSGNYCLG